MLAATHGVERFGVKRDVPGLPGMPEMVMDQVHVFLKPVQLELIQAAGRAACTRWRAASARSLMMRRYRPRPGKPTCPGLMLGILMFGTGMFGTTLSGTLRFGTSKSTLPGTPGMLKSSRGPSWMGAALSWAFGGLAMETANTAARAAGAVARIAVRYMRLIRMAVIPFRWAELDQRH